MLVNSQLDEPVQPSEASPERKRRRTDVDKPTKDLPSSQKSDSLPTPPYTSINQTSVDEGRQQITPGRISLNQNADVIPLTDIENMSRESLLMYCEKHHPTVMTKKQNTTSLKNFVYNEEIRKQIEKLDDVEVVTLLQEFKLTPNKNKPKRRGQLFATCKKDKSKIVIYNRI